MFAIKVTLDEPYSNNVLGSIVEALPGIQPAEAIEAAGELARARCFERWPISDGWSEHHATIVPVTKAFYEAAMAAKSAGILEREEDPSELPGRISGSEFLASRP